MWSHCAVTCLMANLPRHMWITSWSTETLSLRLGSRSQLPETVALIEEMDDCEAVIAEAASWTGQTDDSDSRDLQYLQLAYAAAAIERGVELGCE